jgi:hypothetical protein
VLLGINATVVRCWETHKRLKTRDRSTYEVTVIWSSGADDDDTVWKLYFFTPPHVTVKAMIDHLKSWKTNQDGILGFPHAKFNWVIF